MQLKGKNDGREASSVFLMANQKGNDCPEPAQNLKIPTQAALFFIFILFVSVCVCAGRGGVTRRPSAVT